jgi:hypothetical protein
VPLYPLQNAEGLAARHWIHVGVQKQQKSGVPSAEVAK